MLQLAIFTIASGRSALRMASQFRFCRCLSNLLQTQLPWNCRPFYTRKDYNFFFSYKCIKQLAAKQHKTAAYKFPFSRSFFRNKMDIFFFLVVLPFIFSLFTSSPRDTSPSFFAAIFGFNVDGVSKGESQWKSEKLLLLLSFSFQL